MADPVFVKPQESLLTGGRIYEGTWFYQQDGTRTYKHDEPHAGHRIYFDPARDGWWVVEDGVRFVVARGQKAGQWCNSDGDESSARAKARRGNREQQAAFAVSIKKYDADHMWVVLDLYDLGISPAAPTAPRFIVVLAEDLRFDDPFYDARFNRQVAADESEDRRKLPCQGDWAEDHEAADVKA